MFRKTLDKLCRLLAFVIWLLTPITRAIKSAGAWLLEGAGRIYDSNAYRLSWLVFWTLVIVAMCAACIIGATFAESGDGKTIGMLFGCGILATVIFGEVCIRTGQSRPKHELSTAGWLGISWFICGILAILGSLIGFCVHRAPQLAKERLPEMYVPMVVYDAEFVDSDRMPHSLNFVTLKVPDNNSHIPNYRVIDLCIKDVDEYLSINPRRPQRLVITTNKHGGITSFKINGQEMRSIDFYRSRSRGLPFFAELLWKNRWRTGT